MGIFFSIFEITNAQNLSTKNMVLPEVYVKKVLFEIPKTQMEQMRKEFGPNNLDYAVFKNPDIDSVEFQVDQNENVYILFGDEICILDSKGNKIKNVDLNLSLDEKAGGKVFCVDENGNMVVTRKFNVNGKIHFYNIDKGYLKTENLGNGKHLEKFRLSKGVIYSEKSGINIGSLDSSNIEDKDKPPSFLDDFIEPSAKNDPGIYNKKTGVAFHAPRTIDGFNLIFVKSVDLKGNVYVQGVSSEESPTSTNGAREIFRLFKFDRKFNLLGFVATDSFCESCIFIDVKKEVVYSTQILPDRYIFYKWEINK